MAHIPFRRRAVYAALLWGGAVLPLAPPVQAASTDGTSETVTAPPALMLAQNWQPSLNPAEFLVSEKLDGVRAYWDGQQLRFRSGRPIAAPAWFTADFPNTPLDGELWMGRQRFDRVSAAARKAVPVDAEWREMRYMVFDTPGANGAFAVRAQNLVELLDLADVPWLQAVAQERVADSAALQSRLVATAAGGGEGLVLHRATALWQPGRSDALRKLKLQPDEEARVVALIPGKGRYTGRMGALLLEMPNGQRFALGTGFTDAQRADPPAVGAVVSYRYRDRTPAGLPKFASFLRVREVE